MARVRVEVRKIIQVWQTSAKNYYSELFGSGLSVRQRLVNLVPFFINMAGLATFAAFIWYAAPNQSLFNKATVTLIFAIFPLHALLSGLLNKQQEWWQEIREAVGFLAFVIVLLIIAVGFKEGIPGLGGTTLLLMMSAPAVWLYWKIAGNSLVLKVWFFPMAAIASTILFTPQSLTREGLNFAAAPFMVASYGCALWVFPTKGALVLLARAKESTECLKFRVHGMEALSMFLLATPLVCLTMLAVNTHQADTIWVAVSGVVVSILFGSAVSKPLGQLLVELRDHK